MNALLVASTALLVLAMAAAAWARKALLVVRVSGRSMEPAFHDGDRLLVIRGHSHLAVGTVIAFTTDGLQDMPAGYPPMLVKRIAAVGAPLPEHHINVLGETPKSLDSRILGPIPLSAVVGRVAATLDTHRSQRTKEVNHMLDADKQATATAPAKRTIVVRKLDKLETTHLSTPEDGR